MAELNASVRIEAPVETVFAFVDDYRNVTRFLKHLDRWDPLDPAKLQGLGIKFRGSVRVGPVTLEGVMEVTEHVPLQCVAYRSIEGPNLSGRWTFEPDDDATIVHLRNTYEVGGLIGRVVKPIISTQGKRELDASLRVLKRMIETGQ